MTGIIAHYFLPTCFPQCDIASKLSATGLHRVFVLDEHEKPIGVVSVRDLIRFMVPLFTKKTYAWA